MGIRTILGLLIVLIGCSCIQQTPKNGLQNESSPYQHLKTPTGLTIENGNNQGLRANAKLEITNAVIYYLYSY
jgi:hypothetical protein